MRQYQVTGMSCAACQARVEKAVSKLPGVDSCAVSLLTNSMGVEGEADPALVIKAVEDAGYGAALLGAAPGAEDLGDGNSASSGISKGRGYEVIKEQERMLEDKETPVLKRRLLLSLAFLLVLMYFSMGHMMFGWPLPGFMEGNHVAMGIFQMILSAIIMLINKKFFTSGFKSLIHRAPNMDTLVALGSMTSFVWSVVVLFKMSADVLKGDEMAVMADMDNFYFESAAMIVTLITVGKMLEAMSKGRTTNALKSLMKLAPETATVLISPDGAKLSEEDILSSKYSEAEIGELEIPIEELGLGDLFAVKSGDSIPVDGVILSGNAAVDESALTGESMPVDKKEGDEVSAATISRTGYFRAKATKIGEDTTLAKIIKMVNEAASTKAPIAKIADKVSGVFVPVVIGIAILVTIIWLAAGREMAYALARGISVLVVSCPCALGLATPVAIMVGNGKAAKNGILFKTSAALESTGRVEIVALDKTGTITTGEPVVTDLAVMDDVDLLDLGVSDVASEDPEGKYENIINNEVFDLIKTAASLEAKSEHPIAMAISRYAESLEVDIVNTSDFTVLPGRGLSAKIKGSDIDEFWGEGDVLIYGGNPELIEEHASIPSELITISREYADRGKTPIFFACVSEDEKDEARDKKNEAENSLKLIGVIAVADALKEDSVEAIRELHDMGIRTVMLTGDNETTAKVIAGDVGVDGVIAGVKPDEKESVIRRLAEKGKVAMIGDGINDAPALTRADIGIAIGAGTNVAIDAADVVLMNSGLGDAAAAIRLSRKTLRNIHQNLFWAFIYNILLIPLAAGLYVNLFNGLTMSPMLGAAAMSLSSFCVCMNALRLNLVDPHRSSGDVKRKNDIVIGGDLLGKDRFPAAGDQIEVERGERKEAEMEKTLRIEGMMCEHCEATVKKTLEALEGVSEAKVSHVDGSAVVLMSGEVSDEVLKQTVEDKEYRVISIE